MMTTNKQKAELEKAREIFPESSDLVWELARRYHLVERMPVTAGILYRKVLELEPEGSALARQAEMEILKLTIQPCIQQNLGLIVGHRSRFLRKRARLVT